MNQNLLPYDGEVYYMKEVFSNAVSTDYFQALLNQISWEHDEGYLFGRHYITDRKVAWYGDQRYNYNYGKKDRLALPWLPVLSEIKTTVEAITNTTYNTCLLNLYHHGNESMGWHSDNEKEMKKEAPIASLSLGARRKFKFKHRITKEVVDIYLDNGSLLLMKGKTQENWLHALPKSGKITSPRINLTFRIFVNS